MQKSPVTVGLLVSGLIVLIFFGSFWAFGDFASMKAEDLDTLEVLGFSRYLLLLLAIFYIIWQTREKTAGRISFKAAFRPGWLTGLIISVFVGLMEGVYIVVNPGFMQQYSQIYTQKLNAEGKAAEAAQFQAEMKSWEWMANPWAMGGFYLVETLFLASAFAALLALIFSRMKPKAALS